MIEVSVTPRDLVVGRRTSLSITFANTARGACTDIVFKLRLPTGVVLMGGSDRVEIPVIPAGRAYTHKVTVEARRSGQLTLTSSNFSYRDERVMPVRVSDFHAMLTAKPAPVSEPVRKPVDRLRVRCQEGALDLAAWDKLTILVTNSTGVQLHDVTVAVHGPFESEGKPLRIAALRREATQGFPFRIKASDSGRHVPATVEIKYRYQDEAGMVHTRAQEDTVTVVVRPAAVREPAVPDKALDRQTILYLAASPSDLPPLRSDLEMRKVKERLQLGRDRDRYRIEPYTAVRFDDISQALIDHEPQVVHFSGHGDKEGNLCVENERGDHDLITPEGLAALFGQHKSTLRCVIVSACYSRRLAEALAAHIEYVVGMRYRILDEAAIQFSVGFYTGFFGGQEVPAAFERGKAHIQGRLALEQQHLTPLLFPPGTP